MGDVTVLEVVGYVLVTAGVLLLGVAGIGLVRLSDAYSRLSAVTKAATSGVCLVLLGVLALEPSWPALLKVLLALVLQLATSPVGGYALGRAAYRSGTPLSEVTGYDELAERSEG